MKKRLVLVSTAALLALVPAAAGALGNTSLSHRIPVTGPTATPEPGDDDGGRLDRDLRVEPGDDRVPSATETPSPSTSPSDDAVGHDVGDDHGGLVDRDQRTEPGDDRDVQGGVVQGRDVRGSDDPASHDLGDDHGGTRGGSDDSSGDDDSGHGDDD